MESDVSEVFEFYKIAVGDVPETDLTNPEHVERFNAHHNDRVPKKPLGKPCHDCAVLDGFYEPYAEALKVLSPDRQKHHADRWFCHNHPNRACAGVREHLCLNKDAPND